MEKSAVEDTSAAIEAGPAALVGPVELAMARAGAAATRTSSPRRTRECLAIVRNTPAW